MFDMEGYDPRTYSLDQNSQSYDGSNQNFNMALQSLLGRSVQDYDYSVPPRLGCARAVSLLLEKTYGLPIREAGCPALEQTIQRYGWVPVDPGQMQPGDVIIAYRQPGDHGHTAVYVGNNMVYNNNSNSGRIQLDSLSKFRSREYRTVNVYRKVNY